MDGPPPEYRFVQQFGRKVEKSSHTAIRSHAMKGVRKKQRQQKQLEIVRSGQQSVVKNDIGLRHCSPLTQLSSASSEQYSQIGKCDIPPTHFTPASEPSHLCGKVKSLGMSPSQRMNIAQQLSSPKATLAATDFDPFNSITELHPSLTSKFSNEINVIKAHAIAFCSPGTIKSAVLPEAFRTPGLLASILYMTYSYLRSERGWSNPELALGLKMAAISQINLKLSHPSTATCTNVIASIAYLCTGTWIFGSHFEEVETHLDGLGIMVKQRGMESLGVYQFGRTIRKYIFVQHLLLAAIRAQPPTSTFDLDYNRLFNSASVKDTKHVSPLYCPQETFAQLLQSKQFSEDTVDILYNAKALIDLVIDVDEGTIKEVDFNITLFHIKNELERHISADDPQGIPDCNWVFECCRLTVAIMLKAMETSQPLLSSSSALTHSLVSALEKTDIGGNWGELSGVLYWVSMIGSASSQGRPGHRVLDSALGRTMSEIAFTASDFGSAVEPVRKFSRLQLALKRRSQVAVPENSHRKY